MLSLSRLLDHPLLLVQSKADVVQWLAMESLSFTCSLIHFSGRCSRIFLFTDLCGCGSVKKPARLQGFLVQTLVLQIWKPRHGLTVLPTQHGTRIFRKLCVHVYSCFCKVENKFGNVIEDIEGGRKTNSVDGIVRPSNVDPRQNLP